MRDPRTAEIVRTTSETDVRVELSLDGRGTSTVQTGLGFFDHMLTALFRHARFDATVTCGGDLHIDDHHTIEDVALCLGSAVDRALGERLGVTRFAHAYAPLDEALCRCVIDLSGRPAPVVNLSLERHVIGPVACENLTHFFVSFATTARCALHVDILRGSNDHHKAEAAFKAFALALRRAARIDDATAGEAPSTKGTLT